MTSVPKNKQFRKTWNFPLAVDYALKGQYYRPATGSSGAPGILKLSGMNRFLCGGTDPAKAGVFYYSEIPGDARFNLPPLPLRIVGTSTDVINQLLEGIKH